MQTASQLCMVCGVRCSCITQLVLV